MRNGFGGAIVLACSCLTGSTALSCAGTRLAEQADRGRALYADGLCAEALRELTPLLESRAPDGRVLFEAFDCMERSGEGNQEARDALRLRAVESLRKAVAGEKAGVAHYHYLTALQYRGGSSAEGAQTGLAAIRKYSEKPDAEMSAVDRYHLGSLYGLMRREDLGMSVFRRAAEGFEAMDSPPRAFYARALVGASRADAADRDFSAAAARIDRAREIDPQIPVDPMVEGMAMMGAGRFAEAEKAWYRVLEPAELVQESQIRARLCKHCADYKTLPENGPTGRKLEEYTDQEIETAIVELVPQMREFRKTFPPGWRNRKNTPAHRLKESERETLLRGMHKTEREFLALNREYLFRGHPLFPLAHRNAYVDLLR